MEITLEDAMTKWFDVTYQIYNKLETIDSIYLYDDGQEHPYIRICKKNNIIDIVLTYLDEFYMVFGVEHEIFIENILKWSKSKFNLNNITSDNIYIVKWIPFKIKR